MKRKQHFKRAISILCLAAVTAGVTLAASWRETITVDYGVGIQVNGAPFIPTDANGVQVAPFIYNGTTFVPLRAVSQALDCTVDFNANTRTVMINTTTANATSNNVDVKKAATLLDLANDIMGLGELYDIALGFATNAAFVGAGLPASTVQESVDSYLDVAKRFREQVTTYSNEVLTLANSDSYYNINGTKNATALHYAFEAADLLDSAGVDLQYLIYHQNDIATNESFMSTLSAAQEKIFAMEDEAQTVYLTELGKLLY